ncbi:MAG TPA: SIMPL domain-containing protein [Patescibacteria group bacterium]|nr:SIMPL domain-containing protein [Patescibacteria group bacterium]
MQKSKLDPIHSHIILVGIVVFIFLWLTNLAGLTLPITITNKTETSEFSVTGEGKVDVVPDTAEISAGIQVNDAKTSDEAEQKVSEENNKIIAAVEAVGVKKEDIKTSNYSINPNVVYEPFGGKPSNNGYAGNATVTIKVRDVKLASKVIDAATSAGSNYVSNNGFTVDDPSRFREEARNKAIEDAKSQAQKLASQLGINLGKITNIVESSPDNPQPMMDKTYAVAPLAAGRTAPDIQPGTGTISSTVTLYFETK